MKCGRDQHPRNSALAISRLTKLRHDAPTFTDGAGLRKGWRRPVSAVHDGAAGRLGVTGGPALLDTRHRGDLACDGANRNRPAPLGTPCPRKLKPRLSRTVGSRQHIAADQVGRSVALLKTKCTSGLSGRSCRPLPYCNLTGCQPGEFHLHTWLLGTLFFFVNNNFFDSSRCWPSASFGCRLRWPRPSY